MLCALPLRADASDDGKAFYIQFNARGTIKRQDWSGRAKVSVGTVTRIELDSNAADGLKPDGSWKITTSGKPPPPAKPAGLLLTVHSPDSATITIHTQSGDFSFCICDATPEGLDKLNGNVRVFLGWPEHIREPKAGGKR